MGTSTVPYFSQFGGLWTDRADAEELLQQKISSQTIFEEEGERVAGFIRDGYVILEQAVPLEAVDKLERDLAEAFADGDERLLIQEPGEAMGSPLRAGTSTVRKRVVDAYAYYDAARDLLFAEPIARFLTIIFEDAPLLFQSLTFDRGSQQGMHQDTAYVVTSSPLELAASWIALQDVEPSSGELMYYEGSHRLPEYLFSGEYKHWNPERDGDEQHAEFLNGLDKNARALGMPRRTFLPRKGDALIWAADLAHGGSPVSDDSKTRKSLVGHYCPNRVDPHYFSFAPEQRAKVELDGAWYSSRYYDLGEVTHDERSLLPPAADAEPHTDDPSGSSKPGPLQRLARAFRG